MRGEVWTETLHELFTLTKAELRRENTMVVLWAIIFRVHGHTRTSFGVICALSMAARIHHEHLDTRHLSYHRNKIVVEAEFFIYRLLA